MSSTFDDFHFFDDVNNRNSSSQEEYFKFCHSPTDMEELEMSSISNPPSNTTENYFDPGGQTCSPDGHNSVKEGLKEKIKLKRPDLQMDNYEIENEKPEPIPPEVMVKIEERRKKNCLAARKCRHKRKNEISVLSKKIRDLEAQNRALVKENNRLKREACSSKSNQFVYCPDNTMHPSVYTQPVMPPLIPPPYSQQSEFGIPNDLRSVQLDPLDTMRYDTGDQWSATGTLNCNDNKGFLSSLLSEDVYEFNIDNSDSLRANEI